MSHKASSKPSSKFPSLKTWTKRCQNHEIDRVFFVHQNSEADCDMFSSFSRNFRFFFSLSVLGTYLAFSSSDGWVDAISKDKGDKEWWERELDSGHKTSASTRHHKTAWLSPITWHFWFTSLEYMHTNATHWKVSYNRVRFWSSRRRQLHHFIAVVVAIKSCRSNPVNRQTDALCRIDIFTIINQRCRRSVEEVLNLLLHRHLNSQHCAGRKYSFLIQYE